MMASTLNPSSLRRIESVRKHTYNVKKTRWKILADISAPENFIYRPAVIAAEILIQIRMCEHIQQVYHASLFST